MIEMSDCPGEVAGLGESPEMQLVNDRFLPRSATPAGIASIHRPRGRRPRSGRARPPADGGTPGRESLAVEQITVTHPGAGAGRKENQPPGSRSIGTSPGWQSPAARIRMPRAAPKPGTASRLVSARRRTAAHNDGASSSPRLGQQAEHPGASGRRRAIDEQCEGMGPQPVDLARRVKLAVRMRGQWARRCRPAAPTTSAQRAPAGEIRAPRDKRSSSRENFRRCRAGRPG